MAKARKLLFFTILNVSQISLFYVDKVMIFCKTLWENFHFNTFRSYNKIYAITLKIKRAISYKLLLYKNLKIISKDIDKIAHNA